MSELPQAAFMVTGSRTWRDEAMMRQTFNTLWLQMDLQRGRDVLLLSGGARGADELAERLWTQAGLSVERHPADWDRYGRRAGILRNTQMLQRLKSLQLEGVPVQVVAFAHRCTATGCNRYSGTHHSHGTLHAMNEACARGLPLHIVGD